MDHKQGYKAEIHDDVIVKSETPQSAPKARVQPSFKNWHTWNFVVFSLLSVISVASLLTAAVTCTSRRYLHCWNLAVA